MTTLFQIPIAAPMTADFFHVAKAGLVVGDVIQPGMYGALNLAETEEQQRVDPNGEHLRERIRKEHFSSKPNRMKSIYVWETLIDARNFRERYRPGFAIYRVKFDSPGAPSHRVCSGSFSMPGPGEIPPAEYLARQFWEFPPLTSENNEVFAESAVTVAFVEDPGA